MLNRILYRILEGVNRLLDKGHSEYMKARMNCGKDVVIKENVLIYCPERVTLADGVAVGGGVTIMAQGGVDIGEHTMIAPGVTIMSVNHDFAEMKPPSRSTQRKRPVKIGKGVFIAGGAIILPGVKVGDSSVIAAGAVVNRDVPPNSIVAGVPAKLIRERYRPNVRARDKDNLTLFDLGVEEEV